jgi:hypothetical protein
MASTIKSWNLIYRYTYNHLAMGGFPTHKSADQYNRKYFADTDGCLGQLCHVVPDYYQAPYQELDDNGDVIPRVFQYHQ